ANIVDQLADRTKAIAAYLSRKKITDTKILTYVEHIRTTTSGLRQQLGHLTPSLKFARTTRTNINLITFCENLAEYHQSRWKNYPISLAVRILDPFSVKINQGKLTQVFDNLIINSDYWLKEDLEAGRIDKGIITIRISEPHIVISDNGRGIDPSIEAALFEPSVSRKKNGRGLGLYVAQQLLDSEGCSIKLRARRNSNNRFYQFELDLSGCLIDGVE
ncbi:ATP-binding protein, partial [Gimesia panareensis]|uniref:ATP-binding protein n=1 Tax=Gimesia panareensis TaxID=2527978 RepID=UPI00119F09CE